MEEKQLADLEYCTNCVNSRGGRNDMKNNRMEFIYRNVKLGSFSLYYFLAQLAGALEYIHCISAED